MIALTPTQKLTYNWNHAFVNWTKWLERLSFSRKNGLKIEIFYQTWLVMTNYDSTNVLHRIFLLVGFVLAKESDTKLYKGCTTNLLSFNGISPRLKFYYQIRALQTTLNHKKSNLLVKIETLLLHLQLAKVRF